MVINWNQEQVRCLICDSSNFKVLSKRVRYNEKCSIVKCKNCSFIYMNPQPSQRELNRYYKTKYRTHYNAPEYPTKKQLSEEVELAKRRIKIINIYLKKAKTILDFGCGTGTFLSLVSNFKLQRYGIEPYSRYREFADKKYELKRIFRDVKSLPLKKIKFDVITLFHVLEHLKDPINTINQLSKMLSKNGIIVIEVPNTNNFWLHTPWAKNIFLHTYFQPAHLWYFNPKTLIKLFKKTNLKRTKVTTTGTQLPLSKKINYILRKNEIYEPLREFLYFIPERLRLGENLFIIVKKK